jgi:prepilin-type N-terminal cleavage/methylation domain-containing protein
MKRVSKKVFAFTLIELLIVVAIIAILAAIAVPNFLEAQVRSKVSRVKSDMRSFAVGLEAYMVDHNHYPRSYRLVGETRTYINSQLTTPIAYLTSVFPDPFNQVDANPDDRVFPYWGPDYIELGRSTSMPILLQEILPNVTDGSELNNVDFWILMSFSPDQDFDCLDSPMGAIKSTASTWPQTIQQYDSTNGTISDGDVFKSNLKSE